ncbi:MAG TPA: hypothetical protein VIO87_09310 [Methylotenera sp.]
MARNLETTKEYLADLPEIVTAELLAQKMRVGVGAIYMRVQRQKDTVRQLLPERFGVTKRHEYHKTDVINWWINWFSGENPSEINQLLSMPVKRGRPRKTSNLVQNSSY